MIEPDALVTEGEPAVDIPPPAETQDQVWERTTQNTAPITKEELRGEPPKEEEPTLPDRALVAPEIAEYFQTHTQETPDPTLSEVESLRARLEELAAPAPEPTSEMQQLVEKIAAMEQRDLDRAKAAEQKAAEEDEEARMRTYREGVKGNIRSEAEKYPGLIALSLEDNVCNTVINERGKVSEYEVAGKAEAEVWEIYEILHAIKTKNTSEQPTASEAPKPITTLTPDLTAVDEPWSLDDAMKKGKREAQAELWERIHANQ